MAREATGLRESASTASGPAGAAGTGAKGETPPARLLLGRKAVVTGASSGIGRAIALAYAAAGADLLLTYRGTEAGAAETAERARALGVAADVLQVDLGRQGEPERLVARAWERLGRVDVWVNNAGADILTGSGARLGDREKLEQLVAVDLLGTITCSWAVAERMQAQGGGVILNMSWDHVTLGMQGRDPEMFSAVKGGVLSFSKSLARSVAPAVRVNVLAPGFIATAFADEADDAWQRKVVDLTPLRRWGTPDDVAAAALFLASPAAEFMTGVVLPINGGVV